MPQRIDSAAFLHVQEFSSSSAQHLTKHLIFKVIRYHKILQQAFAVQYLSSTEQESNFREATNTRQEKHCFCK